MKIAVIGSCRATPGSPWPLRNEGDFSTFCTHLGEELAKSGHFLIVPCDNDEQSADFHCLRGFSSVSPNPTTWKVMDSEGRKSGGLPKGHIDAAQEAHCVIIIGGANGTYAAGMAAAHGGTLVLPVSCFGGATEELLGALRLPGTHVLRTAVFSAARVDSTGAVAELMRELAGHPRLLIVHGRSKDRDAVREILAKGFSQQLHRPVVLERSGRAAVGLAGKFKREASSCTGAIVIATPDDIGLAMLDEGGEALKPNELSAVQPRARENVWVEMGWLWARLGRERILMLQKAGTNIPSDLKGAVCVPYRDEPKEVEVEICSFVGDLR